ncbi:MAG: thioredoxin [Candidatus Omnitrophota bacterium]
MPADHLKPSNFQSQVLRSDIPVLVDFYADWCGPCKMLSPIVDQLSDELEGKAKVFKLNVDEGQEIAAQYNIMSIPNLLLFKNGEVAVQMVGAMPKDQLLAKMKPHI